MIRMLLRGICVTCRQGRADLVELLMDMTKLGEGGVGGEAWAVRAVVCTRCDSLVDTETFDFGKAGFIEAGQKEVGHA